MAILTPPIATNADDAARWDLTGRRHRMLDGEWEPDLRQFMQQHIQADRLETWGAPNQAFNLFKMLVQQINVIYDDEPRVRNTMFDPESEGFLAQLGIWPRLQKHAMYVIGLRESAIRIEHSRKFPLGVNLRLVTPDFFEVEAPLDAPTIPHLIREARPRTVAGKSGWAWDTWDIRDPAAPSYTIQQQTESGQYVDVTAQVLAEPPAWEWTDPDTGAPYLPWVVYHAADAGRMFDPAAWHELVHGALSVAMLWTFWLHAVKEASWEQKYAIDLVLQGLQNRGKGQAQRSRVTVDPTSVVMFSSKEGRGAFGSIGAGIDPKLLAEAIVMYQSLIASHLGISPADITFGPQQGSSGIAISLTRDGLRKVQRKYIPQFRAGDEDLLRKIALVHNTFGDAMFPRLPTGGYSVQHATIPLTTEEINALLDRNLKLIQAGVRSKVDLLMEVEPGMSREEAMERLRQVAEEEAALQRPVAANVA